MVSNRKLPAWDLSGVMPPVRPGAEGHSSERSPYQASLVDLVHQFAVSEERARLLRGLLNYRNSLHEAGLVSGFQWLDGSYMEHVEVLENRPPRDIDVVTFFHLPNGMTQQSLAEAYPDIFNHTGVKKAFNVDSYYFPLGTSVEATRVRQLTYWYSMWSHRRTGQWKGFVQVDLSPGEDAEADKLLATREEEYV